MYRIRNRVTGRVYIGRTERSFHRRWHLHRRDLDKGRHANRHLQADWDRMGADAFTWEIIEACYGDATVEVERRAIWHAMDTGDVYNIEYDGRAAPDDKSLIAYRYRALYPRSYVARALGVGERSVRLWEIGQARPRIENLQALARLYGVQPKDIVLPDPKRETPA